MKILLTGYKGFIGQNFIELTKGQGHEITLFEWGDPEPQVKGHDWVVHLGAETSTTGNDIEKYMAKNYDFSRWLLHQCITHKVNFQYASSASVYGRGPNFKEDGSVDPRSPYAWSKYLFDREAFYSDEIIIQGFRYFNVYGPHEDHKKGQASPFHTFKKQFEENGKIVLFEGSQDFLRDFIHVDRVIEVHMAFMDIKESGIWNIGSGRPQSFYDVAKIYTDNIEFVPMPEQIKKHYQPYTCADLTKLKKTLNI
jgi:ADP-L-glycero-D-manno-heptose 6-epimerase